MTFKNEQAENKAYEKLSEEGKTIVDRMDKTYYMRERLMVEKLKFRENNYEVQLKEMHRDLTEIDDREKKMLELSKLKSLVAYNLFWRVEAAKGATFPEHHKESLEIVSIGLKMIASADPLTMSGMEELTGVFWESETVTEVDEKITRLYEDRGY